MGCMSSKIVRRSLSFHKELSQRLDRETNGLEEIIISKNNGDQFVALLRTANTVAKRLNETKNSSLQHKTSNAVDAEEPKANIETINTWELLAGLEEDKEVFDEHWSAEGSSITLAPSRSLRKSDDDKVGPSRSFRTVEDFDAMVAANRTLEDSKSSIKVKKDCNEEEVEELELKHESVGSEANANVGDDIEREATSERGSRRRAMAKELAALQVPTFEFKREGSLREWLKQGGQVFSPGSYVTPKFGDFALPAGANVGDNGAVFDPELVAHFEHAMEQLTIEEECILKDIIERLEGSNREAPKDHLPMQDKLV